MSVVNWDTVFNYLLSSDIQYVKLNVFSVTVIQKVFLKFLYVRVKMKFRNCNLDSTITVRLYLTRFIYLDNTRFATDNKRYVRDQNRE